MFEVPAICLYKVLAIPNGRGSCTGSQVCLELILNGEAPAAFVLRQPDVILALGVIVVRFLFGLFFYILSPLFERSNNGHGTRILSF